MNSEKITERQKQILRKLIEMYVKSAQPVGSQAMAESMRLSLSSATIRNDMSELEQLGYIMHPHTSAGREPTDKGYRFYVNEISEEDIVNTKLAKQVISDFSKDIHDLDVLIDLTSKVLAALTEQAAIVILPEPEFLYVKDIKIVPLDRHRLIVVWTTTDGVVTHRIVDVERKLTPELCRHIMNLLNQELGGKRIAEAEHILLEKLKECRDKLRTIYELARQIMHISLTQSSLSSLKTSGSDYMFEKPEFQDVSVLHRIFRYLQSNESSLLSLIHSTNQADGMRVRIGSENPLDLRECSVVSTPYRLQGQVVGSLAVLGPRRMPYRRMMSAVYYVSQVLSETLDRMGDVSDSFEEGR